MLQCCVTGLRRVSAVRMVWRTNVYAPLFIMKSVKLSFTTLFYCLATCSPLVLLAILSSHSLDRVGLDRAHIQWRGCLWQPLQ